MPSSYLIGDHFEGFIRAQLASGRYATASEVIREALRLLEDHLTLRDLQLAELRQAIVNGETSGPGIDADTVFANVRRRIDEVASGDPS